MKSISAVLLCISLALAVSSCSSVSYREAMKGPEAKFYKNQYLEAARMLLPMVNKSGKDQLLFMMECGYMLHAGGDYATSNTIFLKAAKIAKVIPVSVSQQVESLLTNESSTNYRGEDFEKVLVHMYAGINFLMLKDYLSARVEFRAVNDELMKIKTENNEARYKQNIMAKYLAASAFEITGDADQDADDWGYAYVELKQILLLRPDLDFIKDDLYRLAVKLGYNDDAQKWKRGAIGGYDNLGEILLIFQGGQNAIKVSRGKLFDDVDMKAAIYLSLNTQSLAAGVSVAAVMLTLKTVEHPIPLYIKRSNRVSAVRIKAAGTVKTSGLLEDVESTAMKNHQDNYGYMKTKLALSIATKAAVSVAAGIVAKKLAEDSKRLGGAASLIGFAAGMATGALLFSQMKPDLRCWHTLPAKLQLARIFVRPGKHSVSLEFLSSGGEVLESKNIDAVIAKREKFIINERSLY